MINLTIKISLINLYIILNVFIKISSFEIFEEQKKKKNIFLIFFEITVVDFSFLTAFTIEG